MRLSWSELTADRVSASAARRVRELPHALAWRTSAQARSNRSALERYRDAHRGGRCVVIGNGPSLARMDLSPLRHEVTFGTNRLYLLFERMGFSPSYYVSTNELVLEQYHRDIAALGMPRFLGWNRRALFTPGAELMFVRTGLTLFDYFGRDATATLCSGGTVTFVALQLAYYMGFREVILVGVDHHFGGTGTPNRVEVRTAERDDDHCHPDYFPRGSRWQLPDLRRSEQAYALARRAFAEAGGRVLDATVGGRLRVFDKVDYGHVFGAAAG